MGRRRKHDKHLPARWVRSKGVIYYIVPENQRENWGGKSWYPLGKTEPEAYRTFAAMTENVGSTFLMSELFERYLLEYTPTKRPKTQKHQRRAIANLLPVFGKIPVSQFESKWAFTYYEERKKAGISAANQDIKTLSHCFTMAIKWGVISNDKHPLRGLQIKQSDNVRDRYIEDWELSEALKVADDFLFYYVVFKLLTGMDKSTILSIRLADLTEQGITARRIKTQGKARVYEWSPALVECVAKIRALPRPVSGLYLFCNRKGQPYIDDAANTSGFDSKWRRFMNKALTETGLKERFTEHDLRAKAASDEEDLDFARALLGHSDPRITKKVYRRKAEKVKTRSINISELKGR